MTNVGLYGKQLQPFNAALSPKKEILEGKWSPPQIERVAAEAERVAQREFVLRTCALFRYSCQGMGFTEDQTSGSEESILPSRAGE